MRIAVTLRIEMTSGVSEADLYAHLRSTVEDIRRMRFDSWRTTLSTDWETAHPVAVEIEEVPLQADSRIAVATELITRAAYLMGNRHTLQEKRQWNEDRLNFCGHGDGAGRLDAVPETGVPGRCMWPVTRHNCGACDFYDGTDDSKCKA